MHLKNHFEYLCETFLEDEFEYSVLLGETPGQLGLDRWHIAYVASVLLCCHKLSTSSFNTLWDSSPVYLLTTFSDECLGLNTDEGRSEV